MAWLTVREAAETLKISDAAVRKRMQRGTLRHEKCPDGRVYVYMDYGKDKEAAVQQEPNQLLVVSAADFFRTHPAMLGSVVYLVITSMGMVYAACLYRNLGINIVDFAELNDFLLAAFKDVVAFIMSIVTIILGIGATVLLSFRAEKLRQEKNNAAGRLGLVARLAHWKWAPRLIIIFNPSCPLPR
jgi:hypothetical protein